MSYHHQVCSGLDEFRESATDWAVDFRQLERGLLKSDVFLTQTGPIVLAEASLSLRLDQRGVPPPDCWTFAFVGEVSSNLVWRGKDVPEHSMILYGPETPIDCTSWPGFTVRILSIHEKDISDLFGLVALPDPRENFAGGEVIRCDRLAVRDLFRYLSGIRRACLTGSPIEGSMSSIDGRLLGLLSHLEAAMQSHIRMDPPKYRVRDRAVRRAVEFIEDSGEGRVTVGDLCRVSEVSIRTLEYGFKECFGITPEGFLKNQRLNGVHRELVRSEPNDTHVTDVANRWDFWHMGMFAADYRKLFDELPSETLRKVK